MASRGIEVKEEERDIREHSLGVSTENCDQHDCLQTVHIKTEPPETDDQVFEPLMEIKEEHLDFEDDFPALEDPHFISVKRERREDGDSPNALPEVFSTVEVDVEAFINSVRRHPMLWDLRNNLYEDRDAVRQGWNQVGREFHTESKSAKTLWKNLQDTFQSELERMTVQRSGEEASLPSGSNWHWFEHMIFMKNISSPHRVKRNLEREVNEEECQSPSIIPDANENTTDRSSSVLLQKQESHTSHNSERSDSISPSTSKYKKTKLSVSTDLLTIEKKKLKMIQMHLSPSENHNSCYHFLMSLLPTLRRLPPQSQLRARIKLQEVLLNELQNCAPSTS